MSNPTSRRRFLQQLGLFSGAMAASPLISSAGPEAVSLGGGPIILPNPNDIGPMTTWEPRAIGATYMGGFRAPKIDLVRVAFIGVGKRGISHVKQMAKIEGAEVVAVCDVFEQHAKRAADAVERQTGKAPKMYSGSETAYIDLLKEVKPDAVIVCPSWEWHARITCDVMKYGSHVFVEVPMACSIKELWEIVDTSEKTGKHCMQMENVNYGRDELLYLNMVRQGVIGDLLHGEASYIHDLRSEMDEVNSIDGTGSWRTYHYSRRNGNVYPTHGLGPVAQYMNLARGDDNFGRLVSFSSPALGRAAHAKKKFPADHKWNQIPYECGDINTSIIKTTMGRTVLLQGDETSPRPYSRHNMIQGTLGTLAGFPTRVAGETLGDGNFHKWIEGDGMQAIYEKYEHPLWARIGDLAQKMGGHGGMDYVMPYHMMESLRDCEPIDQTVNDRAYDCAASLTI